MKKRVLSLLCAVALLAGLWVAPVAAADGVALTAQGWLETICAEVSGVTRDQITAVSWTGPTAGSMTSAQSADDQEHGAFSFKYLVRDMAGGGVRIDIPGVAAGTYTLTVDAAGRDYVAEDIAVKAHDRSGFAHWVYDEKTGTGSRYTQGVGAYNDDGTLKDNAYVLYVTDENKDTITIPNPRGGTVTGIGYILNSKATGNNQILKGYSTSGTGKRPLAIRFVGTVSTPNPESLSKPDYYRDSNNEWDGGNGYMASLVNGSNLTLEGVGADATIDGWGFDYGVGNGDTEFGCGKNLETRNLSFRNVPEDCMAMGGNNDNDPVSHVWIHNCSFYVPTIPYVDVDKGEEIPTDGSVYTVVSDKKEGDGATDNKLSRYTTVSYNYYYHYHKTGLMGGGDTQKQYHITWHHNFFDGCDQRVPLVRQADLHYYNNLVKDQKTSGISLRANCYVFAEYNSFESCKSPIENKNTGGVCKSFENVFTNTDPKGVSPASAAVIVTDKSQTVESANPYANFDTDLDSYVAKGDYLLDADVNAAKELISAYAGAMKAMTDIEHPDVHRHQWSAWVETVPVTCTTAGSRYRTCSVPGCPLNGREEQTTLPQGHNYQSGGRCALCGSLDPTKTYSVTADGVYGALTASGNSSFNASNSTFTAAANVTAGDDGFFTLHFPSGGLVDTSNKTFEGTKCARRIRFKNGVSSSNGNCSIEFTTTGPATVKIWWVAGENNRQMAIYKAGTSSKTATKETVANNGQYISTLELKDAGTYYLGGDGGNNYIFGVFVTTASSTLAGGTMGEGDGLRWSYSDQGELSVTGLEEDQAVLAATFDRTGRFTGLEKLLPGKLKTQLDCGFKVRLFWLDDIFQVPQSAKVEF